MTKANMIKELMKANKFTYGNFLKAKTDEEKVKWFISYYNKDTITRWYNEKILKA